MRLFVLRWASVAAAGGAACLAHCQFAASNVQLAGQINLTTFSASSGNSCWGYVSPSGREYAIMGLNNKVAFVEVTNPYASNWFASIPHAASQWADIKVYGHYAYVCTETAGTGIQVIDMSLIDAGIVTLVRTVASPGRSHTLALNPDSGYLYTCGSRDGTGTTMCFSLADPSNPVRVGPNTLTPDYMHEAQVVSYVSGPYAGKEIFFGFSTSKGVDIYDVTNKNAPTLIKRVTYPNIGYCHQGWLSADRKYLYVDDEFDETNLEVPTRSLIFNVEDLANAFYVGTFTTGLPAIDHNQYVADGFTFQANYRSGLRVFDISVTPTAPVQTGWLDTYPENDNRGYQGAWSNYPFFPSGTVIVSDINRGLFVLDTTEATTRDKAPIEFTMVAGAVVMGGLTEMASSDDSRLVLRSTTTADGAKYPVQLTTAALAHDTNPTKIRVVVESRSKSSATGQVVELYDWLGGTYVPLDFRIIGPVDSSATVTATGNLSRFVDPTTRRVKARLRYEQISSDSRTMQISLDQVQFRITR